MGKKKVLFTATVVKTHMMQFHLPYLKLFQDMGWETAVASKNDYEDPADCQIPFCDQYYNIPFARLPWKKDNLTAYRQIKKIIDEEEYDLIHCHTPVGAMITRLAALAARKKGTKVIYTAHGFHFFKGAPLLNWLMFYPVEWMLAPVTDCLITINKEDYALAQKRMKAKQLAYVPGVGIRTEKFHRTKEQNRQKRQELGFREDDFLILTVAEMTANKNHITTLNALAALKDTPEFEKMHYLIVGRGEMWPKLEESAAALGIQEHVHFLGYRTDAAEIYGCCDIFSFLSFREGLPVALMEAMASGLAVVCTRIRGNTDLVEDEVNGLFVENNPQAAAEAFLRLYRDPQLRAALGQKAAQTAEGYDEKPVHEQVRKIYLSF
ncbi:MAG: glycosyltransferase family 4 protein [Oscillospiraceae bacterium]|nr:glycosyltransferase family 4 protein [Oscillospiraceae bacterium]